MNAQSGNQCSCWRWGCCRGRSSLCWWLLSAPTLRWEKAPSAPGFTKQDASSKRAPGPANPCHVHIFPCPADTFLPSSLAQTSLPLWTCLLQPQGLAWGAGVIFIPGGVRLSLLFGCASLCRAVCPFSSRSPSILPQPCAVFAAPYYRSVPPPQLPSSLERSGGVPWRLPSMVTIHHLFFLPFQ